MKSITARSVATIAIATSLSCVLPVSAFADTSTTTSTTTTTIIATSPMMTFIAAEKAYDAKLEQINATFVKAVNDAETAYKLATAIRTSSSLRIIARSAMRIAIANATVARDASIKSLGKPPINPDKSHRDPDKSHRNAVDAKPHHRRPSTR